MCRKLSTSLMTLVLLVTSAIAAVVGISGSSPSPSSSETCRCFPGDACWPSEREWTKFNQTLGGALIATKPIGNPCHVNSFGGFSKQECANLRAVWTVAQTHISSSSSIMAPYFANFSCDPFAPKLGPCVIGTYVQFTVNASHVSDYIKTINFVHKHNIRLTIRNTGHDYYGKSTGAGAVAIWTHNLKNIEVLDYKSPFYRGMALKVGAGVDVIEATTAAHAHGLVVVGGNDRTVGFAGGYTQGGGHGQLVSRFGMAADQVLEWEVVTGEGKFLTASPRQNSDLYWALSGGGGGTYGVVLSMTVRAHPDTYTAAANLTFTNSGVSQDAYYDVVETFINTLPALVDAGGVSVWLITNTTFTMTPASGLGLTVANLSNILLPTIKKLEENNLTYTYFVREFPTFLDSFDAMSPTTSVNNIQIGGRFIPRSLIKSKNGTKALMVAIKDIANKTGAISGIALDASQKYKGIANAVNPEWRGLLFDAVVGTFWSNTDHELNIENQRIMTDDVIPQLEKLTPGGGAYLSEGDFQQSDWQQVFYGVNYKRLKGIKAKYDPFDLFYALTAVGSDAWTTKADGRLCRVDT